MKMLIDANKLHAGENRIQTTYLGQTTKANLRADGMIIGKVREAGKLLTL
jgi:hypothetical protein